VSSLNANAGRRLAKPPSSARIFGSLVRGKGIEFVAAYGTQQDRVAGQSLLQRVRGQGRAVLDDGHAADAALGKREFMPAQLSHVAQNRDRFVGNFGTDAIAGDDQNSEFH